MSRKPLDLSKAQRNPTPKPHQKPMSLGIRNKQTKKIAPQGAARLSAKIKLLAGHRAVASLEAAQGSKLPRRRAIRLYGAQKLPRWLYIRQEGAASVNREGEPPPWPPLRAPVTLCHRGRWTRISGARRRSDRPPMKKLSEEGLRTSGNLASANRAHTRHQGHGGA